MRTRLGLKVSVCARMWIHILTHLRGSIGRALRGIICRDSLQKKDDNCMDSIMPTLEKNVPTEIATNLLYMIVVEIGWWKSKAS